MPQVSQLGRVMVPVSDQDKAIDWYKDKLGFVVAADVAYGEGDRWVEVSPPEGNANVALVPPMGGGEWAVGRMTGIAFESTDLDADYEELKSKGVECEDPMGGDETVPRMFFFKDGDGNQLLLVQATQ
ncbi:MAG: VOC family protein [Actinomycetota bacterium]